MAAQGLRLSSCVTWEAGTVTGRDPSEGSPGRSFWHLHTPWPLPSTTPSGSPVIGATTAGRPRHASQLIPLPPPMTLGQPPEPRVAHGARPPGPHPSVSHQLPPCVESWVFQLAGVRGENKALTTPAAHSPGLGPPNVALIPGFLALGYKGDSCPRAGHSDAVGSEAGAPTQPNFCAASERCRPGRRERTHGAWPSSA